MRPVRIMVADSNPICLAGLTCWVAQMEGLVPADAIALNRLHYALAAAPTPDLLLLGNDEPRGALQETLRRVKDAHPHLPVIVVAETGNPELVLQVLEAGAAAHLERGCTRAELELAIHSVLEGLPFWCPRTQRGLAPLLLNREARPARKPQLNTMEQELLRLICAELVNKQIAPRLGVAEATVERYRARLMQKLGAKSVAGLVLWAVRNGVCADAK